MRGSGAVECEKVHGTGKGLVWRWQACMLLPSLPEPLSSLPVLKSNPLKSPSLPKVHACSAALVRPDSYENLFFLAYPNIYIYTYLFNIYIFN